MFESPPAMGGFFLGIFSCILNTQLARCREYPITNYITQGWRAEGNTAGESHLM